MKVAIEIITEELKKRHLKVVKIILFGSRAKGTFKKGSDWDFFVIIDRKMSFNEKWDIIDEIKIELARRGISNDIILKSEEEVEESKDDVGRITYYVLKEGIEV
jgi:predicted nucleotidyltransferase